MGDEPVESETFAPYLPDLNGAAAFAQSDRAAREFPKLLAVVRAAEYVIAADDAHWPGHASTVHLRAALEAIHE